MTTVCVLIMCVLDDCFGVEGGWWVVAVGDLW